jgi:hypothetical protein
LLVLGEDPPAALLPPVRPPLPPPLCASDSEGVARTAQAAIRIARGFLLQVIGFSLYLVTTGEAGCSPAEPTALAAIGPKASVLIESEPKLQILILTRFLRR